MTKKSLAPVLVLMIVGAMLSLLPARAQHGEIEALVTQLRSEDIQQREMAAKTLGERKQELLNRPDMIAGVESIVRTYASQEGRRGTVKSAIVLLGRVRSSQSVPLLVEYLTFGVFYKDTKRLQTLEDYFPAVGALIEIGTPSIEPVLKRAEASDDATVLRNAAIVLQGVLKTDATTFIEQRANRESNPQVHQRLLVMQQVIERWDKAANRTPSP